MLHSVSSPLIHLLYLSLIWLHLCMVLSAKQNFSLYLGTLDNSKPKPNRKSTIFSYQLALAFLLQNTLQWSTTHSHLCFALAKSAVMCSWCLPSWKEIHVPHCSTYPVGRWGRVEFYSTVLEICWNTDLFSGFLSINRDARCQKPNSAYTEQ